MNRLIGKYPNKDLIDIGSILIGDIFSKIIGIIIFIYFLIFNSVFLWDFAYLINLVLLPHTPFIIIMIITILCTSYMVKKGISVISKLSLILFPVILIVILTGIIINISKFDYSNFQPILEFDIKRIIKAAAIQTSFSGIIIISGIILPKNAIKRNNIILYSVTISYIIGEIIVLGLFLTFKEKMVVEQVYKFLMMFTGITIFGATFVALFIILWIFIFTIAISMTQYAANIVYTKLFKDVEKQDIFILPVGLVIIGLSMILFESRPMFDYIIINLLYLFTLSIEYFIPAFLLSISYLKYKIR